MEDILVPIFVCVVLPVSIVLIVFLATMNSDNKRAQILSKAIDANPDIDIEKLADKLKKHTRTGRELLNLRLLRGCIFSLIGLALVVFAIINSFAEYYTASGDILTLTVMGGVSLAIGISYIIVYAVTRKQIDNSKHN